MNKLSGTRKNKPRMPIFMDIRHEPVSPLNYQSDPEAHRRPQKVCHRLLSVRTDLLIRVWKNSSPKLNFELSSSFPLELQPDFFFHPIFNLVDIIKNLKDLK